MQSRGTPFEAGKPEEVQQKACDEIREFQYGIRYLDEL